MKTESGRIAGAAANLFPGYFALVMATGIISIATHLLDMRLLAWAMLAINLVAYVTLWLLLLIRLVRFFPRVKADITDHVRGQGFFTVVAGTCVLGSQLVIVAGQHRPAGALWLLGLGLLRSAGGVAAGVRRVDSQRLAPARESDEALGRKHCIEIV
jgi:tellurite resistance protein TehA-like permease